MPLFEIKPVDRQYYAERIRDFLPDRLIDIHTHVWRQADVAGRAARDVRNVSWPSLVAAENPIEDLLASYRLLFPGKEVTPLIFGTVPKGAGQLDRINGYVGECAAKHQVPALIFSDPAWDAAAYERKIAEGGFLGAKCYLSMCPAGMPANEITIFDFFPPHQLEVLDAHGWIMMLHLPRDRRLRDPQNLSQLQEIDRRYPKLKCIVAHVGRAYCREDVGDALAVLKDTKHLLFDISANTNAWVFEQLIKAVGPRRILFGSDLPILRMRMRRIEEDGRYVNLVPPGRYGDVSGDPNMREVGDEEAASLSFFMYEEIANFAKAAGRCALSRSDIEDVFHNNACNLLADSGFPQ